MNRFLTRLFGSLLLVAGAGSMLAGPVTSDWLDQWYQEKTGRITPTDEELQPAAIPSSLQPANTWYDDFYWAKLGRATPEEQRRISAEREAAGYVSPISLSSDWYRNLYEEKLGRAPEVEVK